MSLYTRMEESYTLYRFDYDIGVWDCLNTYDTKADMLNHLFTRGLWCEFRKSESRMYSPWAAARGDGGELFDGETYYPVVNHAFRGREGQYVIQASRVPCERCQLLENMVYFGDATTSHVAYLELIIDKAAA